MPQRSFDDLLDDVPEQRLAKVRTGLERLTPRELEVLKRAISGETAGDSANNLGISVRTVELHRQQVLYVRPVLGLVLGQGGRVGGGVGLEGRLELLVVSG